MTIPSATRLVTLCLSLVAVSTPCLADPATVVDDAVWNDGRLFGTVITPTSFVAPPAHSTDTIYSFMMSGQMGQRSISEAAPGDPDYNGGRWTVELVTYTPSGIAALTDGAGTSCRRLPATPNCSISSRPAIWSSIPLPSISSAHCAPREALHN